MEIVSCKDEKTKSLINDILLIDNKEILLVSLLETLCKLTDNVKLFKKICTYLHKIGIIDNIKSYSKNNQKIRQLYNEYLSKILTQSKSHKLIKDKENEMIIDDVKETSFQLMHSQYSNNFMELEKIGDGGYGEVYRSFNNIDGQIYAIKKVPFIKSDDANNIRAFNEVRNLAIMNHPNVVRYYGTWLELSDHKMEILEDMEVDIPIYPILYIQMELCKMTLRNYLV